MGLTKNIGIGALCLLGAGGMSTLMGGLGSRGSHVELTVPYKGEEARLIREDVRWSLDRYCIDLSGSSKINRGCIVTDNNRMICVNARGYTLD